MPEFGNTFKSTRESRGLTLQQVAARTKIGTRFLDAIEKEELQGLPGGIFSRGFVRTYAECLEMDVNEALSSFDRLTNYRQPAVLEHFQTNTSTPSQANRTLLPLMIGLLIIVIIVFYFATRQSAPSVTADQSSPVPAVQLPPRNVSADPASVTDQPPAASAPASPTVQQAQTDSTPAAALLKDALALVLEAREATWVKVLADGASVNPGEVLKPGTTRRYTAQNSIDLIVGNASGVNVKVNDREVRALGKGNRVRTLTITTENLKDLID
jgi:cytoskeleton protein RodZ